MNYVIWNNKDSRDINGLLISELPPITKPKMRVKETVIDGVDGSIIEELGYESYDKTILIGLKIGADVDEISEFFTGSGEIVFSNEPDKYYKATIVNRIDYARLLRYKVAQVTFRVQPFKYNREEVPIEVDGSEGAVWVENLGNTTAKPIITIKGREGVDLTADETKLCTVNISLSSYEDDTLVVDSEKQDAYLSDGTLKNYQMSGNFPILKKGKTLISWLGRVERIRIEKYSRWL